MKLCVPVLLVLLTLAGIPSVSGAGRTASRLRGESVA